MALSSLAARALLLAVAGAIALAHPAAAGRTGIVQAAASIDAAPIDATESDAALDAYLNDQLDQLGLPGISAAVVRDGVIEHLVALGEADDTGRPMTPQTPIHVASLSKGFAALAVMQLVEAGAVDLDAPVQRYLPWFRVADEAASAQITVAQCLHHTSGISHDDDFQIRLATEGITGPSSVEQGVRVLSAVALRDAPGASFQYTNLGYNIVGAIVEAVSGQPYADYLAAHVFGPLQMTHTFSTINQARKDGLGEGFSTVFGAYWQRPVSTPEALQPSATTFSSAEDLAHEIEMYLAAGSYHGTPLLGPDTEKALQAGTPVNDEVSYRMGWWLRPQWELSTDPGNASADAAMATVIEHGGDWDNTSTYMGYVPSTGDGLVVLINANSSTEGSEIRAIPGNAWRVLLGVPTEPVVPQEDFLQRFGWQIAAAIVLLQVLVAVGTVWSIRRRSRRIPSGVDRRRSWLLGLPLILDGGVLFLGLVLIPAHFDSQFLTLLSDSPPDVAGLVVAAIATAVTSAVTRIVLLVRDRRARPPTWATQAEAPDQSATLRQ